VLRVSPCQLSAAALALAAALACTAAPAIAPDSAPSAAGAPTVIADERGFSPAALTLTLGGPGVVVFRRTTDDTCATAVVFPELGLERELPLDRSVAVELPTTAARTLTFQCGMGMYRSRVVVR
jgi:hypothetical protein